MTNIEDVATLSDLREYAIAHHGELRGDGIVETIDFLIQQNERVLRDIAAIVLAWDSTERWLTDDIDTLLSIQSTLHAAGWTAYSEEVESS